jgi:hypothetical protein
MDVKTSCNYSRFVEVLLIWQELHREILASAPLISWDSALLLVGRAKWFDADARQYLRDALASSDAEFFPLRDPLRLNLGAHRWLSADREESYSDWLAWILQGMSGAADILPLFALDHDSSVAVLGPAEKIYRERSSESGRTDIEVWFGERGLLLIEVKVQPTGEELRSQLDRYEKWAGGQRVGLKHFVLLGTEEPKQKIGPFEFTDWRKLCMRLRRYANRVKNSDLLRAAAVLFFCGAVEQNLIGLAEKPKPFRAMATVDYLREWRGLGT